MFGWYFFPVDEDGKLSEEGGTGLYARCFVFFFWILWVSDPIPEEDIFW